MDDITSLKLESNSSEESETEDQDILDKSQLEIQFPSKYCISGEASISLKKVYLLNLDRTKSFDRLAVGASNGALYIFNVNTEKVYKSEEISNSLEKKQFPTCGVKFLAENENLVLVGVTNGVINIYDLRTNQIEHTFEDIKDGKRKPIICFDVNANSRLICAGTEQIESDSYILFFDLRKKEILGGYWESHQDDIAAVRFHPTNPNCLSTSSLDGLINIFDLAEDTEESALKVVINSESGAQKLNWHKDVYNNEVLSCIDHINNLNIYNVEGDVLSEFSRSDVTGAIKRTAVDDCVLVNCHNDIKGNMFLLAGTNFNKGEVLRSVYVKSKKLVPHGIFDNNKQIIRESIYCPENDILVTGGEGGIVSLWKKGETKEPYNWKIISKDRKDVHKVKPY